MKESSIEIKVKNLLESNRLFFENTNANENASKWLSSSDAAYFLRLSENALRIMVHRNQIQAYKIGRRLRFRLTDCQALFEKKGRY